MSAARSDNVHTFAHLQVYFMCFHQLAGWLSFLRWSFVRSVSSRFLWYLSLWLTWNRHYVFVFAFHSLSTSLSVRVSILFLCFVLFISTIYSHRITECCVCFYADPSLYIRNSMWPTEQHFPSRIRFISVDTIKLSTYWETGERTKKNNMWPIKSRKVPREFERNNGSP